MSPSPSLPTDDQDDDNREYSASPETSSEQRLQKVLASAGLGSRRQCEELILSGRVEVDRRTVTTLGTKVDPARQEIRLDGEALKTASRPVYYLVNKPTGVVCTNYDPSGRTRVIDLVPEKHARLFTVGRLDYSSEGLILLTNDGELAFRLTHPKFGMEKKYLVQTAGVPGPEVLAKLRQGVHLAEGFARPKSVRVVIVKKQSAMLEIVLNEGRNREIRRLLARIGHRVLNLKRTEVAGLKLGSIPPGSWRRLFPQEIVALKQAAGLLPGGKKHSTHPGARPPGPRGRKPRGPRRDSGKSSLPLGKERRGRTGKAEKAGTSRFAVSGKKPRPQGKSRYHDKGRS